MDFKKVYVLPVALLAALTIFLTILYSSHNIKADLCYIGNINFVNQTFDVYYSVIEGNLRVRYVGKLNLIYINESCHRISINIANLYKYKGVICYNTTSSYLQIDPYLLSKFLCNKKEISGIKGWFIKFNYDNKSISCEKFILANLSKDSGVVYCINKKRIKYFRLFNYSANRSLDLLDVGP